MFWQAKSLQNAENYKRAIRVYVKMTEKYPDSELYVESLFSQGESLKGLRRFRDAAEIFQGLIDNFKDSYLEEAAKVHWGDCLYLSDDYEAAINVYVQILNDSTNQNYQKTLYKMAKCYRKTGNVTKALDLFFKIIYEFSNEELLFSKAIFEAAECYEDQDKFDEALQLYEKIIVLKKPERVEALRRIHLLKQKLKNLHN